MHHLTDRLRRAIAFLRTIRVRLTLWYVALLAVILVAFSGVLYLTLAGNLQNAVDQSLVTEANQVIGSLVLVDGIPSLSQRPERVPPGVAIALYDPTGARLIANDPRQPLPVLAAALQQATQGRETFTTARLPGDVPWRILTLPVVIDGHIVGVLQVARSQQDVDVALGQLAHLMTIAIPATLLIAIAGGLFLAGRALGPIDRITRAADEISAEDLSRRLHLSASADEVGRLAVTMDRMLDRLDRAFQRQRQFTADAAHELRTPLAVLTSQADLALERPRTNAEYRETLRTIHEDATRLSQLLSELLTLARADSGREGLVREVLTLDDLVDDVVGVMGPLAEARGVRLEHASHDSLTVVGDQTRLTQLLVNLVDNGLKYTPSGGVVTVSVQQEAGKAVLRVADTGIGIAPEHLPHLFERFYRVDQARARAEGGAGLGLAISQWIARAHGGDIAVESQLGRGSVFAVALPLPSGQPARPSAASPAAS